MKFENKVWEGSLVMPIVAIMFVHVFWSQLVLTEHIEKLENPMWMQKGKVWWTHTDVQWVQMYNEKPSWEA